MTIEATPRHAAEPAPRATRRRLGEVLVAGGVIDENALNDCLGEQASQPRETRQRLGAIVVSRGLATEQDIAQGLARALGLEMVDVARVPVSPTAARLVPRAVAERYGVLGLDWSDGRLTLAMADPTDVVALDDVRLYTKAKQIVVVVATDAGIRDYLKRAWSLEEDASDVADMFDEMTDADEAAEDRSEIDDTPVVRMVNVILSDAVRARASDIHLQPELDGLRVRYRVDGLLRDVMTVPRSAAASMTSRVKIMSGLDIAERRRPQDGRTRLNVDGEQIDARVSTLPAMHGEKVVIRLLARGEGVLPLSRVGFTERQLDAILETLVAPQGLVLITGPTGSGKTSTLYSAVSQMRTPDRNIVTLEDPVEVQLRGITQVQTNDRAGLTFAAGLRSVLRQDPDVVLVGEIRDTETAELALRASLTGHMVFSTLHTNDASAAVTRLVDMGVEPFLIASSLTLVVAQRLVRVPCQHCAAPYQPSPRTLQLLGLSDEDVRNAHVVRGRGCDQCGQTGYHGRTAIFEVLPVDAGMRAVLTARPTESAIRAAARASGVGSLRTDGVARALRGETTLEEVLRVTQVDSASGPRCHSCHRSIEDDMAFCPWCAASVERQSCPGCARRLDPEWRVCPWCRHGRESTPGVPVAEPPAGEARRARVLVVDDDSSVCEYIAAALADVCDVLAAHSAEEALRVAATEDLDAMILDLILPDLSGIEVTRLLRADTRTALLPLLLLTGSDDALLRTEAYHAGADLFLTKPIEPAALESNVCLLLERAALTPEV
ncbi:MAG TPA: ATPase, T2SS/T4P/T4SS family [Mycobacteriales bacterium]|nr:ATPase, T2SS/T4P/T4SS family [Mycobacteriales bacterium]